jgi:sigma-B regulation protein RsbU (phosphoserine phosphatase)
MRLKSIFFILLPMLFLLGNALESGAQNEVVSVGNWRVQAGDNPAWASPDLDDSGWAATSFPVSSFSEPNSVGWHWYRATFQTPTQWHGEALGIGMPALDDVYEVYLGGKLVARFGRIEPSAWSLYPRHAFFRVPDDAISGPVVHIAIRRFKGPWSVRLQAFYPGGTTAFSHPPRIGVPAAIEAQEKLEMTDGVLQMLPADLSNILFLFAAAIGLVLYSVQRRRPEYLFLCVFCVTSGVGPFLGILTSTSPVMGSRSWLSVVTQVLSMGAHAFSVLFLAVLCRRFRRVLLGGSIFLGVTVGLCAYGMAADAGHELPLISTLTFATLLLQFVAVLGLLLDRDRGSLAIGIFLLLHGAVTVWYNTSIVLHRSADFTWGPFLFDPRNLANVVFIFAVLNMLYLRYREEQARQAAIDQGLAAARRMQQQLLASSGQNQKGYDVTAVYRPAQEVGGDFYRTELLEDGSMLVVVGDVSGKGMDAALLVAATLGSLANEMHRSPASLLDYLNRAVMGRTGGGFITACCARFNPDGRVTLANAGHISPCIDGRELELAASLPLGITAQAEYSETTVQAGGRTVTFLSDGVVEARNAAGELLGFERMAALSTRPAAEIADAAERWGQEDDITVLTVAWMAA